MIYKEIILGETTDQGPVSLGRSIMHRFKRFLSSGGRYYTKLDRNKGSHYRIQYAIPLNGEFTIELKCKIPSSGGYLLANTQDDRNRIMIASSGTFLMEFAGTTAYLGNVMLPYMGDDEFHTIKVKRTGYSTIKVYVDDGEIGSTSLSRTFTLDSVGSKFAGSTTTPSWDEVIADVKIYRGTTLILDAPLDGDGSDTLEENKVDLANSLTGVNISSDQAYFEPSNALVLYINSRYFTKLESALNSYYEFTDTVTLSGDFEIEVDFVKTDSDNNKAILGQIGTADDYLAFVFDKIRLNIDGSAAVLTPAAPYIDGKIHTLRVVRIGNVIEMYIDEVNVDTGVSSSALSIDYIGAINSPTSFFNGYLANLKITDGSTLVVDAPIDGAQDASYEVNKAATLGSEEWVTGALTLLDNELSTDPILTVGLTYIVTKPKGVRVKDNGTFTHESETAVVFTATEAEMRFWNKSGDTIVFTPSIKEIPASSPYLIRQNIATEQVKKFDEVVDGWTGPELITQSVWESPNSVGNQWAFANNQWSLTGDGSNNALLLISSSNQPEVMKLKGNVSSLSGSLSTVTNTFLPPITSTGTYDQTFSKADALFQIFKRRTGVVNATIDKPSLKEFLEEA